MENNDYKEYKDASWELVSRDGHTFEGTGIKFRNKRRNGAVRGFFKGVAFILIAAVSGGATAAYIVDKKYSNLTNTYVPNNPSLIEQKNNNTPTAEIPKNAITKVAETVGPTVVGISNQVENFFGERTNGSGSGIIFDKEGYIVTNYHVIQGAAKVTVKLANSDKVFTAKFVGAEPNRDIAVIKIDAQNLPVAKFGDSSKVKVGDLAIAIGNPLGQEFAGSVTAGIISAVNREIQMQDSTTGRVVKYKVLQTDAAINPGNSGGALVNEAGEIIGINSLKIGSQYGAEGMGFAININDANEIIKNIMGNNEPIDISKGTVDVPRVMLGISGRTAVLEGNDKISGVYVDEVSSGTGADKAGIKPSDIITEVDGNKVESIQDVQDILRKYKVGDVVTCKVWRNGKNIDLKVTLTERKTE
ncbi:trypsin-like peptidase domain-containing protein [Clostridium sp. SYSU_GA19001]|uniref:S1C family serine protease n=1 Tax=Clostridium caldaquaticum TaxID=2940653 RepID=UPI0020774B2A|nr:trypsin-like peptidase domain-containing protein [Clostridium caldaquaticum]MCM8709581.1 trypsin-like peptidase domain-containing protein [Clostridium caldaquaticum]